MDIPDKPPTVKQLVWQAKLGPINMVVQSPVPGGWCKVWKAPDGAIWSQMKIDNGEDCPLQEPVLEVPPKPPREKKQNPSLHPFFKRKKKATSNGHV